MANFIFNDFAGRIGRSAAAWFRGSYKVDIDLSLRPLSDERTRPDGRAVITHLLGGESPLGELVGKP